jgi:hypothetical protein
LRDEVAADEVQHAAHARLVPAPAGDRRADDAAGLELLAAALAYHRRDDKPFWWAHYARFRDPVDEWSDTRSTLLVDGPVEVLADWEVVGRATRPRRELRLTGLLEPGNDLGEGDNPFALYDDPPGFAQVPSNALRGCTNATVLGVEVAQADSSGRVRASVTIRESRSAEAVVNGTASNGSVPNGTVPNGSASNGSSTAVPMALTQGAPPPTKGIAAAIRAIATDVAARLPDIPPQPALDILRRVPPRTRSGLPLPRPDSAEGFTEAITAAVLDLDGSYLAVQGPPGTGKTYTGGHVIAALAAQGWRIGVVAQSHAVIANMLRAVVAAGLPPHRVGKRGTGDDDWQHLKDSGYSTFYAGDDGLVVGGTKWDFVNAKRLPSRPLDLIVVDEAGQFALADVVAVSGAARNLLLLGDPQQLPQVSQGTHPFPVDRSALGWLADGHDTLPDALGYFLERTWRMHPTLTSAVSRLSYEDRLRSVERTGKRDLEGVEPGIRVLLVEHEGNAVSSVEEAAVVVEQVRGVVGRRWRDPSDGTDRPLTSEDVLVVAPYNAQVATVRRALDEAGLSGTRVGTVDKFQGQEAVVALLTTAASSPDDVPRGMEFLLNRNRLNVAVSRAQWCAIVVRARALTDYLPARPEQLAELGAFLGLADPTTSP